MYVLQKKSNNKKIKFLNLLIVDPHFLSESYLLGIRKHNLYVTEFHCSLKRLISKNIAILCY